MYLSLVAIPSTLLLLLLFTIHRLSSPSSSTPLLFSSRRFSTPFPPTFTSGTWSLTTSLRTVSLSLWTEGLNDLPRSLLRRLSWRSTTRLKRVYDLGILWGLLGAAAALGLAGWSAGQVWGEVWREAQRHAVELGSPAGVAGAAGAGAGGGLVETAKAAAATFIADLAAGQASAGGGEGAAGAGAGAGVKMVKRGMQALQLVQSQSQSSKVNLEPLIPGLTVPLSHAPTLALAFALNQLLHELGHATSGALDDIYPSRFSVNLHLFIPSAMVSFPSTVDSLSPNAKMRLASSGPAANLWTYFLLVLLGISGLRSIFWSDHGAHGRVVESVHWKSPLYDHLTPGDLVTHLDDLFLGTTTASSKASSDRWHAYLHSTEIGDANKGWCVSKSTFLDLPSAPCHEFDSGANSTERATTQPPRASDIAFVSLGPTNKGEQRCLPPHPLLDIPSTTCPCPDSKWLCVRPTDAILRIRVVRGGSEDGVEEVVLWRGPRVEVAQSVKVGKGAARGWNGGVRWGALFLSYLSTISLSLYLFNLLPLPCTDGAQLLSALVEWHAQNIDIHDDPDGNGITVAGGGAPIFRATISGEEDVELGLRGGSERIGRAESADGADGDGGGGGAAAAADYELDSEDEASYASVREGQPAPPSSSSTTIKTNNHHISRSPKTKSNSTDRNGPTSMSMQSRPSRGTSTNRNRNRNRKAERKTRWSRYVKLCVEGITLVLSLAWIGGWGMLLLLRSS